MSQLFLPGQIERASELYGGLAATVATLGWFFFMGRAMAFSFVLDATVHDHVGGTAKAVLSLPVLRAIPANVPRLARYLHLPEHDPGGAMDQDEIIDDETTSRFVHVADSQARQLDENLESLQNLQSNLLELGQDARQVPFVLQYNKQDLPRELILTPTELDDALNFRGVPSFPADALHGAGVFETLKSISELVLRRLSAGAPA